MHRTFSTDGGDVQLISIPQPIYDTRAINSPDTYHFFTDRNDPRAPVTNIGKCLRRPDTMLVNEIGLDFDDVVDWELIGVTLVTFETLAIPLRLFTDAPLSGHRFRHRLSEGIWIPYDHGIQSSVLIPVAARRVLTLSLHGQYFRPRTTRGAPERPEP